MLGDGCVRNRCGERGVCKLDGETVVEEALFWLIVR